MLVLVILLLGVHLAYPAIHTLQYFYTATSGMPNFPEFISLGMLDGQQTDYYDSKIKRAIPKADWMRTEGPEYWDGQTQACVGAEQSFKNNINIAMSRFNQSGGVHTFQHMYGCEFDDETGATDGFTQEGYDGEDFVSLDFKEMRYISRVQQGFTTVQKWNNDRGKIETDRNYFSSQCIEWLKKYLQYGKSSLQRKDAPEVFLLQKDPSSPVLCQATGFYPSNIMMTWQKNKEEHYEDVAVGTTLPNIDGTFQKTITLTPEEWNNNKEAFRCVVQHVGAAEDIVVTVRDIRSNTGSDNTIAIVVGCLVAVAVVLGAIVGLVWWKKSNGYGRASIKDSDSEKSN